MPPEPASSPSVAVVCWDLGHNALGRAHLLADMLAADHDVEIVGSHFPEFGNELWAPHRDTHLRVRGYPGGPFPGHFPTMERMARDLTADVVYVVKPRLPALGVGFLAKADAGRPLMVDCDDLELSFVRAAHGLSLAEVRDLSGDPDFLRPQGRTWTSFSEWGVRFADSVTVSNVPLAARYGGSLVPHARDERVFDPELYDREEARARLGFADDDRVVLFAGTPRRHKGIQQIAAALSRIGDRRNRLCVLATRELGELKGHVAGLEDWLHPVPPEPFSHLPHLLAAADVVCLLQDPASETARWQMPAKVSDALAMGVPCLATRMPPLVPLIEEGGLVPVTEEDLEAHLESMLADAGVRAEQARRGRELFLRRLSYAAVRPRLEEALQRAASRTQEPPPDLVASVSFLRSQFESRPGPTTAERSAPPARRQTRDSRVVAVVPYLGGEPGLDRCLSSLVRQTRPPDAIVVADGGSSPPVGVVSRHPGVTLLRSGRTVGPYELIGQVIEDTAADWYLLQDPGAWSARDRLERLLAAASESGAELVGSDHVVVAAAAGLTVPEAYPVDVNAALVAAPTGRVLDHASALVRRSLLERVGSYGDREFLGRAAAVTRIVNVPRPLYFGPERAPWPRPPSGPPAPPLSFELVCGPAPDRGPRQGPGRRAALRRAFRRSRRQPFRAAAPTLVVGGPGSGADTVLWALAQHPALVALPDLSWCAPAADVVERAAGGSMRPLAGVGATAEDLRRALATAVGQLVAGGGDASGWVALVPPAPEVVRALLRLFPDARLVHVVRDADETAVVLARRSTAVVAPLPPTGAYGAWRDAVRGGLECERLVGGDRVLRVRFGELALRPRDVLGQCLRFLGVDDDPACARLVEGFEAVPLRSDDGTADAAVVEVRELSAALCGPPRLPAGRRPAAPGQAPGSHVAAPVPATEPVAERAPTQAPAACASSRPALPDHVSRPAALLCSSVAPGATVAVVTKGEGRFLELDDVTVWHFPQTGEGEWAGYHPKDTAEIVGHLAGLQRRGARYLLIPSYASWWLEHYDGLREHLLGRGSLVAESRVAGSLFELGPEPTDATAAPAVERRLRRSGSRADGFDVVMFWKQHDTGLYGRRHDMLMKHLALSPRVGKVVQFDAPVDLASLRRRDEEVPTHNALLEQLALARVGGVETMPGLHQHSFVYGGDRRGDRGLPSRDEYPVYVKDALARHDVGERPVVFWVYPKHFEFPDIARSFGPDLIVADVVDDHRTWSRPGGAEEQRVLGNYEAIARSADAVLVNCEPMRDLMAGMAAEVHLVPNAAEYPDPLATAPLEVPEDLRGLEGPVVGYVGNLSSRIDVELLERLVIERPDWNLVLVGSAHAGKSITPLGRHPNVALLGPRPYEEAKRFIRAFDVAVIPHVDDAMTRAMNPLKAFVYCALQVPVVSTDIANLGELRPLVSVASDHGDFIAKVDAAIRAGRSPIGPDADAVLRRNSWESRAQTVTALLDEALRRKVDG